MSAPDKIHVLVEQVDGWWVAQCLEHDLATQARTLDDLQREIMRLLTAHISSCEELGIEPFDLPPAPTEVWRRYEQTQTSLAPREFSGPRLATMQSPPIPEIKIAA